MHHFDGAAGEAEGHGPEGGLAGPVGDLIEGCSRVEGVSGRFSWGLVYGGRVVRTGRSPLVLILLLGWRGGLLVGVSLWRGGWGHRGG